MWCSSLLKLKARWCQCQDFSLKRSRGVITAVHDWGVCVYMMSCRYCQEQSEIETRWDRAQQTLVRHWKLDASVCGSALHIRMTTRELFSRCHTFMVLTSIPWFWLLTSTAKIELFALTTSHLIVYPLLVVRTAKTEWFILFRQFANVLHNSPSKTGIWVRILLYMCIMCSEHYFRQS